MAKSGRLAMTAALGLALGFPTSTHAQPLESRQRCVLEKPLRVHTKAPGKGKKARLRTGTELLVLEVGRAWVKVDAGNATGFVRPGALRKRCQPLPAEPTPPIESVETQDASAESGEIGAIAEAQESTLQSEGVPEAEASAIATSQLPASETIAAMPEMLGGTSTTGVTATTAGEMTRALRVAVYDFELQGIDANVGTVVTDSMLAEVRKLQGASAIGMDEIKDMLSHEANRQILGCESDNSCLAEIAGALGVDELLTGRLTKAGDSHTFLLRRIDQRRAKVAGVVNRRLKAGSGEEFLLSVGPAVEELYPDRPIRAGKTRGVPDEVAIRLSPPPLPTWSFWSVAAVAVAAGAAGGVFGLLAHNGQEDYRTMAELGRTQTVPGAQLDATADAAESFATAANTLWISAGAIALTAGVMYLFTDWEGYGDATKR